jgi:hypothetical protein
MRLIVQPNDDDDDDIIIIIFCPFPSNGAPVKWNCEGKTEELGEKPVPVPLCPPQIPHGLTRDRTRASAVGGWRLTAWAMARPDTNVKTINNNSTKIKCFVHFAGWIYQGHSKSFRTAAPSLFFISICVLILTYDSCLGLFAQLRCTCNC